MNPVQWDIDQDLSGIPRSLAEVPKLEVLEPTHSKESSGNTFASQQPPPHMREEGYLEGDFQKKFTTEGAQVGCEIESGYILN